MIVTYLNRFKDKIFFEDLSGCVVMSGHNPDWMRQIYSGDTLESIDGSGGPFISIGEDLRYFFEDDKPRIIKSIQIEDKTVKFEL